MCHLSRRDQRDDLHRMSAQRGVERGARRRHVVQYTQHTVRLNRSTGRFHITVQRVVAERAERSVRFRNLF